MWHPHPLRTPVVADLTAFVVHALSAPTRTITRLSDELDEVWEPFLSEDDPSGP